MRETKRDRNDASLGEQNTAVLLQKLHVDVEEEGLDQRVFLILSPRTHRVQELPLRLLGHVAVDEHAWLGEEVKVVILVHQTLRSVAL